MSLTILSVWYSGDFYFGNTENLLLFQPCNVRYECSVQFSPTSSAVEQCFFFFLVQGDNSSPIVWQMICEEVNAFGSFVWHGGSSRCVSLNVNLSLVCLEEDRIILSLWTHILKSPSLGDKKVYLKSDPSETLMRFLHIWEVPSCSWIILIRAMLSWTLLTNRKDSIWHLCWTPPAIENKYHSCQSRRSQSWKCLTSHTAAFIRRRLLWTEAKVHSVVRKRSVWVGGSE